MASHLCGSDADTSDDDVDAWSAKLHRKRRKTINARTDNSPLKKLSTDFQKLPELSKEEKENALESIGFGEDKDQQFNAMGLQVVLWELGCNYSLQRHQFLGVRAMAGVSDDFPGYLDMDDTREEVLESLEDASLVRRENDRGLIMADVMGLGKTVQAVAACILRNAIANAKDEPKKPTLISSPNEAVLVQWHETLVKAGVDKRKIFRYQTKKTTRLTGDIFILCTMYDFLTEARYCFDSIKKRHNDITIRKSPLFASASETLLRALKNQYRAAKGYEANKFNKIGADTLTADECIKHKLAEVGPQGCSSIFRTAIIDEAHFLKNLKTFWGITAGLIGLHTERMIPMSGTPFCNTLQDMATLVTFISPNHPSADHKWWKKITKDGAAQKVVKAVSKWGSQYIIRRGKDVIASQLPKKIVRKQSIFASEDELSVYGKYEAQVLAILWQLKELQESNTPMGIKRRDECFRKFVSAISCAMAALVHPVLPSGGRDMSILFSPSRGRMTSILRKQEKPHHCVCCKRSLKMRLKKKRTKHMEDDLSDDGEEEKEYFTLEEDHDDSLFDEEEEFDSEDDLGDVDEEDESANDEAEEAEDEGSFLEDDDGDSFFETDSDELGDDDEEFDIENHHESSDDEEDEYGYEKEEDELEEETEEDHESDLFEMEDESEVDGKERGTGDILPIDPDICPLGKMGIRHFACESCQENLAECPKCNVFLSRLQGTAQEPLTDNGEDGLQLEERTYCPEIFGGFQGTPKLNGVISNFAKLPDREKALIVSFNKGCLDLLEAMFNVIYPDVEVARFDGDIDADERNKVLQKFREVKSCRALLMTVQNGGTGLNLVEANHVLFVDRHWKYGKLDIS